MTVDRESWNAKLPNEMECKLGRSIQYKIENLPWISNEDPKKFNESYSTSPILMEYNNGRLLNLNIE